MRVTAPDCRLLPHRFRRVPRSRDVANAIMTADAGCRAVRMTAIRYPCEPRRACFRWRARFHAASMPAEDGVPCAPDVSGWLPATREGQRWGEMWCLSWPAFLSVGRYTGIETRRIAAVAGFVSSVRWPGCVQATAVFRLSVGWMFGAGRPADVGAHAFGITGDFLLQMSGCPVAAVAEVAGNTADKALNRQHRHGCLFSRLIRLCSRPMVVGT